MRPGENAIEAARKSAERRAAFADALRAELALSGVDLAGSVLGRDANVLLWIVTVQRPGPWVLTLHVPLPPARDPTAPSTARYVAGRVVRYLKSRDAR
jgi:hypothetical protein